MEKSSLFVDVKNSLYVQNISVNMSLEIIWLDPGITTSGSVFWMGNLDIWIYVAVISKYCTAKQCNNCVYSGFHLLNLV